LFFRLAPETRDTPRHAKLSVCNDAEMQSLSAGVDPKRGPTTPTGAFDPAELGARPHCCSARSTSSDAVITSTSWALSRNRRASQRRKRVSCRAPLRRKGWERNRRRSTRPHSSTAGQRRNPVRSCALRNL